MGKKVLMIGPGEQSISTSGLGKAASQIASFLSKRIDLTLIQPKSLSTHSSKKEIEHISTESFNELKVIKDMVKIEVSNTISPYWYSSEPLEVTSSSQENSIQKDLYRFSQEIEIIAMPEDFDIIYAHDWLTFPAAESLKKKTGKPLVLHVHSLDYDRSALRTDSWIFDLEKLAFQKADKIITVSNYSKGIVNKVYGIPSKKIHVAHNGYESIEYPDPVSPFHERIVLFVGRLTGQKGPTQFLEIAEKVHEYYPDSRFIMAGAGDMYNGLVEAGATSSVAGKFHLTGYLTDEDLKKLYAMADIYCMPSVSEPFGLTALEAADADIPTVISKNSGASEVLEGAVTVDFHDTDAFAAEIIILLKNKELREEKIKKNKKSLLGLSWEKTSEKVLEILEQV